MSENSPSHASENPPQPHPGLKRLEPLVGTWRSKDRTSDSVLGPGVSVESIDNTSDFARARTALITRILDGAGQASSAPRRAAFDNTGLAGPLRTLTDKVANHAYRIVDADYVSTTSRNINVHPSVPVNHGVGPGFRVYLTQF